MAKPIIFDILAIDEASATFTKVGLAAGGMATKVETAGKVASRGFLYAGVAAGALAIHSLKMAGNFDAAIVRLETTAGESKAMLGTVSDGLLNMAHKVGYTAQELAKGMYTVESAGYHGAAGLKVMEAAAKGARVEGADLTATTNAVSSLLVDYHLNASAAARVTNVLTAAVGHGKTTFEQLATALPNVAAAGASARISMEEIASAIATMTMHGTDAAKAGTYLRQVIGQLEAPTAKATGVMKDLGISANHLGLTLSSGSGHGLADAIKMIDDGIRKHLAPSGLVALNTFTKSKKPISDYKKVLADLPADYVTAFGALSKMVGGVKSLQGFLQLGGANLKTYRANVRAVREQVKAGGNDVEGYAQQQETMNGKLNDAQGAASAFSVKLGQDLEPAAKAVLGTFTSFVEVLSKHDKAARNVVVGLTAIATGLIAVKVGAATAAIATSLLGGAEGALAVRMTVAAVATGDFAGAAYTATVAAEAMASTLRMAAGAAGMGALILASHTSNDAIAGVERTMGAFAVGLAVGGPIGGGIGAGIGLFISLKDAIDGTKNSHLPTPEQLGITDITGALDTLNGKLDEFNKGKLYDFLKGTLKGAPPTGANGLAVGTTIRGTAQLYGIPDKTLVDAMAGNVRAFEAIKARMRKAVKQRATGDDQALGDSEVLLSSIRNIRRAAAEQALANREKLVATANYTKALKGIPPQVITKIKQSGLEPTRAGLADLVAKLHLSEAETKIIIKAFGIPTTAAAVDALVGKVQNLDRQHPTVHVTADTASASAKIAQLERQLAGLGHHKAAKHGGGVLQPQYGGGNPTAHGASQRLSANGVVPRLASVLTPGFTDTARHLSGVFINNLAAGILHKKMTLTNAIDKVQTVLQNATSKLQGLLQARTAIVSDFQGMTASVFAQDFSSTGGSSPAALINYQTQQLQAALQAQADIAKLVSEGLSKSLVLQEANSGSAGLANLHALATGPASDVATLNSLNAQTQAAYTAAGMTAGNSLYGTQIQAAQQDKNTAAAIVKELEAWRRQHDKNTVVQLVIGAKTVQATLLELKRHNGNKPLGLT